LASYTNIKRAFMNKVHYEIDPHNRLVISEEGSGVPRQRRVIEGAFKIGAHNDLSYHVKSPLQYGSDFPSQIRLSGRWSLSRDHDLIFTVDSERGSQRYGSLKLAGSILEANGSSMLFAFTTKYADGSSRTGVIELTGSWRAGEDGRLIFSAIRRSGEADELSFVSRWQIDRDNALVYYYDRPGPGPRGRRSRHRLSFRGRWSFVKPSTLVYELEGRSNSSFRIRAGIAACYADRIVFELGAGAAKRLRPAIRSAIIYGAWRLVDACSIDFEIEYYRGGTYSISFGAQARVTDRDTVTFSLKDHPGRNDLGIQLELRRELVKGDGSLFMRVLKSPGEAAVMAGGGINW
jgi:hypothetical protein